jgi:hypothetical protein
LVARGLLASSEAGLFNREANADFHLVLTDRISGRVVYQDEVSSHLVNGNVVTFDAGVFAHPQDLRAIAVQAQNHAVGTALNKTAFLAALRGG